MYKENLAKGKEQSKNWKPVLFCFLLLFILPFLFFNACDNFKNTGNDEETGTVLNIGLPAPDSYSPKVFDYVPDDFMHNVWLQYGFKELTLGQNDRIWPRRVDEGITHVTNNNVYYPKFKFEVVSGDSVDITVLEIPAVNSNGANPGATIRVADVKAIQPGITIIKVTYDAFNHPAGKNFPASSEVNAAYIAYSVSDGTNTGININVTNEARYRYDTVYFLKPDTSRNWPIIVNATGATDIEVSCNGYVIGTGNGTHQLPLKNTQNIVRIKATNAEGQTRYRYEMINARMIEITTTSSHPSFPNPNVDIPFTISFKGITSPVYKLATIYNPQVSQVQYKIITDNNREVLGASTQWNIAANNAISVTINKSGQHKFAEGKIIQSWYGDVLGSATNKNLPGDPNMNAVLRDGVFSFLPEFTVNVLNGKESEGGGGHLTTVEEVESFLTAKTKADEPVSLDVQMAFGNATDAQENWIKLLDVLNEKKLLVKLDLSKSTGSGIATSMPSQLLPGQGDDAPANWNASAAPLSPGINYIDELILPNDTTTIRSWGLASTSIRVIRGAGVQFLHNFAFQHNPALEEVDFPNLVTIGHRAFPGTKLKEIFIPNTVTGIGVRSQQGHGGQAGTSVGTTEGVDFSAAGGYAFNGVTSLTKVTIEDGPNAITNTLANAGNTATGTATGLGVSLFVGTGLTHIELPGRWRNGARTFENLTSLTHITFNAGATTGTNTFNGCSNVTKVFFKGYANPAAIANQTFPNSGDLFTAARAVDSGIPGPWTFARSDNTWMFTPNF